MAIRRQNEQAGGGSSWGRLGVLLLVAMLLVPLAWSWALGQEEPPRLPPAPPKNAGQVVHVQAHEKATRDSLVVEIRKYSEMISAMRDSLSLAELGLGVELGPKDKAKLEKSIQDVTLLIEEVGSQLGDMDLEIANNRISLLDSRGEGIVINIPENIDEQLSQGLNVLSNLILSELPDSVQFFPGMDRSNWKGLALNSLGKKEKRKVIKGNIVKVWDPLQVTRREDVRGNVVVVFGDVEVSGRVDGNVVVVFGNLQLTETAEVTGTVMALGGRLDQDPDAEVRDVTVIDPWRTFGRGGPESIFNPGLMSFLVGQGEFLAMLIFSMLAFTLAPVQRLTSTLGVLTRRPLPSLGVGVVGSVGLHMLALLVIAILVLTVIGIPVALLVAVALVVLAVIAVGLVALVIGRAVIGRLSQASPAPWVAVLVGLMVLHSVSFIGQVLGIMAPLAGLSTFLVILGLGIKTIAYFLGLGSLLISRFGSLRPAASSESPIA